MWACLDNLCYFSRFNSSWSMIWLTCCHNIYSFILYSKRWDCFLKQYLETNRDRNSEMVRKGEGQKHNVIIIPHVNWGFVYKLSRVLRRLHRISRQSCTSVPVVESCPRQDHGVVIGPFRGVAPAGPGTVPVVAPCGIADDALRKALPHRKGKIHLREQKVKKEVGREKRGGGGGQWKQKKSKWRKTGSKDTGRRRGKVQQRKSSKRCKQVFKTHRNTQDLSSL